MSSWPPQAWKIGGGSVWGWPNYDAELNSIYYGTGNPGPWNADQRPGDNKWTAGIFSRDPASGSARWFYQFSPHDEHDYDGVNEQILLDMPFGGQDAQGAGASGSQRLRVCDRSDQRHGAFRRSLGPVNSSKGVDLKTRPADHQSGQADQAGRGNPQHLSHRLRCEGLESQQLQPRTPV